MSFVKNLAKTGLFGLVGLAGTDKKKEKSLITPTATDTTGTTTPSLISRYGG